MRRTRSCRSSDETPLRICGPCPSDGNSGQLNEKWIDLRTEPRQALEDDGRDPEQDRRRPVCQRDAFSSAGRDHARESEQEAGYCEDRVGITTNRWEPVAGGYVCERPSEPRQVEDVKRVLVRHLDDVRRMRGDVAPGGRLKENARSPRYGSKLRRDSLDSKRSDGRCGRVRTTGGDGGDATRDTTIKERTQILQLADYARSVRSNRSRGALPTGGRTTTLVHVVAPCVRTVRCYQ